MTLTAPFLRIALPDVLAGLGRVRLAAVRTAQVLQVSVEGLQRGSDTRFGTQDVIVGLSFVLVELWRRWRISGVVVLAELYCFLNFAVSVVIDGIEVLCSCCGRTRGPRRTSWPRFSRWTLKKNKIGVFMRLNLNKTSWIQMRKQPEVVL